MSNKKIDKKDSVSYDPHIIPAETAARIKREGKNFKSTAPGQTVDSEGIANIHAVEPEPYVNEPGDQRGKG
jgi:hypothetical protein